MKKWYTTWMAGDVAVIPVALLTLGLVLGIIGLIVFSHSDQMNSACNSTLGQLGQGFDSSAAQQCASASHTTTVGSWLAALGLVSFIIGGVTLRNSIAIARARSRSTVAGGMT